MRSFNPRIFFFFIVFLSLSLASCETYKNIPYYQDAQKEKISTDPVSDRPTYLIHSGDILGINVTSRNPETVNTFNYNLARVNGTSYNTSPDNPVIGYLVDENGNIHLPLIGDQKVAGLSLSQITKLLSDALVTYLKDAVVNVRVVNFKVYVYGDVARPNVYNIQDEHPTLTQVLTMAGDLNITALRKKVMLIRYEDGQRKYITLDLTSKKIFESPYFYLKNNDEIYVSPGRTKTTANLLPAIGIVISALSVVAIILTRN